MFLLKTMQSRVFIKAIMALSLCLFALSPICSAEKITVIATGEYIMGDGETKTVAKERADLEAMRSVTEKAGVYVESYTKTINSVVDEDVIRTISSNILQVQKKEYSLEILGESIKIISKVTAMVDTKLIEENTNLVNKNRQLIEQNKTLNKQYDNCLAELKELKSQLNIAKTQDEKKKVENAIKDNENKFKALHYEDEGTILHNKHDYNGAILKYTKAIEMDNTLSSAYANRGTTYYTIGNFELALNDLNKAISLKDDVYWYYRSRGNIHASQNNHEQELKDYNKAISLNPHDAKSYGDRATYYYNKNEYLKSMDDAIKAVELNPYNPIGYISKAMLFEKMNKPDKALMNFNKAIELEENTSLYYMRGLFYYMSGDYEHAMTDYDKAIALDSNNYMAISNKAILLLKKHQYEDALKLANRGLKINQNDADLYAIKAASFYHLNNIPMARENLLKALKMAPDRKDYYGAILEY